MLTFCLPNGSGRTSPVLRPFRLDAGIDAVAVPSVYPPDGMRLTGPRETPAAAGLPIAWFAGHALQLTVNCTVPALSDALWKTPITSPKPLWNNPSLNT